MAQFFVFLVGTGELWNEDGKCSARHHEQNSKTDDDGESSVASSIADHEWDNHKERQENIVNAHHQPSATSHLIVYVPSEIDYENTPHDENCDVNDKKTEPYRKVIGRTHQIVLELS